MKKIKRKIAMLVSMTLVFATMIMAKKVLATELNENAVKLAEKGTLAYELSVDKNYICVPLEASQKGYLKMSVSYEGHTGDMYCNLLIDPKGNGLENMAGFAKGKKGTTHEYAFTAPGKIYLHVMPATDEDKGKDIKVNVEYTYTPGTEPITVQPGKEVKQCAVQDQYHKLVLKKPAKVTAKTSDGSRLAFYNSKKAYIDTTGGTVTKDNAQLYLPKGTYYIFAKKGTINSFVVNVKNIAEQKNTTLKKAKVLKMGKKAKGITVYKKMKFDIIPVCQDHYYKFTVNKTRKITVSATRTKTDEDELLVDIRNGKNKTIDTIQVGNKGAKQSYRLKPGTYYLVVTDSKPTMEYSVAVK